MTEKFHSAAITCLLLIAAAVSSEACAENHSGPGDRNQQDFVLYLVRHAEKSAGGFDPDLTEFGRARAEFMAEWYASQEVRAVWTSDFKRTRNTALPLAERLGLEIRFYDPRDQAALVEMLKAAGETALVVGHSNTIPELAALLCRCDVAPMPDSEYERTFAIAFAKGHAGITEPDLRTLWTDRPAPND